MKGFDVACHGVGLKLKGGRVEQDCCCPDHQERHGRAVMKTHKGQESRGRIHQLQA